MRTKFLFGVAALTAVAVVQWLPTTAQAADEVPTACITTPAPQGPPGEKGPTGDKGEPGDKGPDGAPPSTIETGPSRQVHPAVEALPLCDDIEGLCIVKLPGQPGPIGDKGEQGDKGEPGDPGDYLRDGPSRAPHSLTGTDPCAGVDESCEITLAGPAGDKGPQGDKGEQGDQGPQGDTTEYGPSRSIHPQALVTVVVQIPQECRTYLDSLSPDGGGLPATGTTSGALLATAAALMALGASALLVRRRTA